jgi:hypothetical protein
VTVTCSGGGCKRGLSYQIGTVASPVSPTQSTPGDAAPPAQAGDDGKEQSKPTNWVQFADVPVNSTFYFAHGRPEDLWLKRSTNLASQVVSGRAVQVRDGAMIQVVSQGVDFEKVPLKATFYFLLDVKQVHPWIKASSTTAINLRDRRVYSIRSGLVTLTGNCISDAAKSCSSTRPLL